MINLNARLRIVVLVFASALPILGLTLYNGIAQRAAAEAGERDELRLIAELTAKRPEQLILNARQLLVTMAANMDSLLRDRQSCHEYFDRLSAEIGGIFRAAGVILPDGTLHCNSSIANPDFKINVGDRPYFRMAMDSGKFTVGEYQVGRTSGQSGINFAYPVFDADKRPRGVVFASLNLSTFIEQGEMRREGANPQGVGRVVTIYDRNDIVLAQYPAAGVRVGEKSANAGALREVQLTRKGTFIATDMAGVTRLYAVENVGMNPDSVAPIRVVVSIPTQVIFAEADQLLRRTLFGIAAVTLLVMVLAWYGAEIFVLRRFRVLLDMADRVRGGDLGARSGFGPGNEELTRLGAALDAMAQDLQSRDRQLQEAMQRLNQQAATDQLTGLPNRRYLWEALGAELMRARRKQTPLAVILLDIDHFKQINDRWGHEAGDLVLKNVTYAIRAVVRGSDIVARHGGEEFVIVLPEAADDIALARAEAVRAEIAGLKLTYGGDSLGVITASFGVVVSRKLDETAEELVRIADHAMYEAKQGGRNRVVLKNTDSDAVI
ncbi:MAG: diguanylate cyclase [Burkholderiales bacterium]|nr:diguanylate cyclase [Burkholderiales bacterium]